MPIVNMGEVYRSDRFPRSKWLVVRILPRNRCLIRCLDGADSGWPEGAERETTVFWSDDWRLVCDDFSAWLDSLPGLR